MKTIEEVEQALRDIESGVPGIEPLNTKEAARGYIEIWKLLQKWGEQDGSR